MKLVSRHHTTVSLQGNIAVIELSNIFQIFDYGKMSGELRIISEQNNASFFFQEGMLIFGALSVNQKKIGELLLESQLITTAQLRQCLEIHARFGRRRRLGEILVGNGFLDFEKLAEILKNQAREAFTKPFPGTRGCFIFMPINIRPGRRFCSTIELTTSCWKDSFGWIMHRRWEYPVNPDSGRSVLCFWSAFLTSNQWRTYGLVFDNVQQ